MDLKVGGLLYYAALLGAGVYMINVFNFNQRKQKAFELVRQATEEDVVQGNQARMQLGGFQQPSFIPDREAMEATERGNFNAKGPTPTSAATNRHARTTKGRRH